MSKTLFEQGCQALAARSVWENKQRLYDEMRRDGLPRLKKPFPAAADMHFPLIDMNVRKLTPFYESHAFGADRLASFTSLKQEQQAAGSAAADYFDFKVKNESNFELELTRAIDSMCFRMRGVVKIVTDPFQDNRIVCESIDPLFIIMSEGADGFDDADWWIHVQQLTVEQYKRNRRYKHDDETINAIKGNKDSAGCDLLKEKEKREGINYTTSDNQIIIWEHWKKTTGGWKITTFSPTSPDTDIRNSFNCPYKFKGKPSNAFYSIRLDVTKGWFGPRGIAELTRHFEQYICKLWNEKTDAMTFANRPVLTSDQEIKNTANIRWVPGEIVPGNLKGVPMSQPPFSFDQEIGFARSTAEQVTQMPDFGIGGSRTPSDQGSEKDPTATEVRAVTGLQSVATESNGRKFRRDVAKMLQHIWGLMLQYQSKDMTYFVAGELKTLPEQALHDAYLIAPEGSPDQWNKQLRQQRADGRLQKFKGAPNVDQDELVHDSLAADDPLVAQKLFIPTNAKAADEQEDEASEILLMKDGFPAALKPNEDHAARIFVITSWLLKQSLGQGDHVSPAALQRILQHKEQHWEMLKKTQPAAVKPLQQQIQQMMQQVAQQKALGAPANMGMPGAGAPGAAMPPEAGGSPMNAS